MSHENSAEGKIGEEFQQLTKYVRETLKQWSPTWDEQVGQFKSYPDTEGIELPDPEIKDGESLWRVIANRRSYRDFEEKPIDIKQLSQLLWACQGITGRTRNFFFRSAPSAGALYPVETYVVANHVNELGMGLYHYDVPAHGLKLLSAGDHRDTVMQAGLNQPVLFEGAAVFVWTAMVKRGSWKYHQRAWRYFYLDCGHICQNLVLAAEALGLGATPIGAFFDEEAAGMLKTGMEDEPVLYMAVVGPKGK
jgi:SagB-type dehydrogenase family enzyme